MGQDRVFAVFGLGLFGSEVCRVLAENGGKVIAVDRKPALIERIKDQVTQAVLIDSTEEEALQSIDIADIDVAVVAIGSDQNSSIITTALLKKLGVPYIIGRALTDIHGEVLRQVGANEVINIELDEGREIARRLISPDIKDRIPISQDQTLAEVVVPATFVGKSLHSLELRKKFSVNVISIRRTETVIDDVGNPVKSERVFAPLPDDKLKQNDVFVLVGSDEDIDALRGS